MKLLIGLIGATAFGKLAFGAAWILDGETLGSSFCVVDFWTTFGAMSLTGAGFGASTFEIAFLRGWTLGSTL